MRFKNKTGESFSFIHLGSRMNVGPEGVELSNTNRELLYTALQDKRLQVHPEDEALAANITTSFGTTIGYAEEKKSVEESAYTVSFHNDSLEEVSVIAQGSRHTVEGGSDLTISGNNKELVAAALLLSPSPLRLLSNEKKVEEAKKIADRKKKELEKEREELSRIPKFSQKKMQKEVLSQTEIENQQTKLSTAIGSSSQQVNFEKEKELSGELEGEFAKGIIPNDSDNEPANGLRVV